MIAYGVVGLLLLSATMIGVAGPLAGLTRLTTSVENQRQGLIRSLRTTERTLDNAGSGIGRLDASLTEASESTTQAAELARGVSTTMGELSASMGLSILGAQPLIGLQPSFDNAARQLSELGTSIDGIGTALAANRTDIAVTKSDIEDLRDEVRGIAEELSGGPKIEVSASAVDSVRLILFGLIAWLALLSAGIIGLGVMLVARANG
jgi:hypothetical protein